jgi:glycerol uptake facilitator-like aquaporin
VKGNRYIVEVIGTFALVFAGFGAIVVNDLFGGALGHIGICMVFGLVVMAMVYATGNISGAHLNPAVTLGFVFAGRLNASQALPYLASQLVGAVAAASALWLMFPEYPTLGVTLPAVGLVSAFTMEVLLSFILMFVILTVFTGNMEKGIMAGVAVGGTVALNAMFGGPLTGPL